MTETRIAKIVETRLGYQDHGIFTAELTVDYGNSGQSIGGYALDRYDAETQRHVGTEYGHRFITAVIRACGVAKWEDVKGRTIMVISDDRGWGAKVLGIGPLPTEPGEKFLFDSLADVHPDGTDISPEARAGRRTVGRLPELNAAEWLTVAHLARRAARDAAALAELAAWAVPKAAAEDASPNSKPDERQA